MEKKIVLWVAPIFCRRHYSFDAAKILSLPIFCLCLGLRGLFIINDCAFVYVMIIINLS